MKSRLFLFLLVVAIAAWLVAIYRLGFFQIPGVVDSKMEMGGEFRISQEKIVKDSIVDLFASRFPQKVRKAPPPKGSGIRVPSVSDPKPLEFRPRLKGVVDGSPSLAILDSAGRSEFVQPKGKAFGWTVVSISPQGVMLSSGGKRLVLER